MTLEEKYKMFGLDDEKLALFKDYFVGLNMDEDKSSAHTIKTVVIEMIGDKFESMEKGDAKLV